MIEISINTDKSIYIEQRNEPPTFYLDHWALLSIAGNIELADRFITSLKRQKGTLALSWMNFVEFIKISDQRQIQLAERLVSALWPQLLFIALDPWIVIQSENEVHQGHKKQSEWDDDKLLKLFIIRNPEIAHNVLPHLNLFSNLQTPFLLNKLDAMGDIFVVNIENIRNSYLTDKQFAVKLCKPIAGSKIFPATRFLLRELLGNLVKNTTKKISRNDAADFFHAIVPLAYCDFVLLDGYWATQASEAADRLHQAGQIEPIAYVFSPRNNGLARFFDILELKKD